MTPTSTVRPTRPDGQVVIGDSVEPLASMVSARLPQGAGNFAVATSDEPPSSGGVRPFALRVAGSPIPALGTQESADGEGPRYCPRRQISIDAAGRAWMGKGEMTTTGQSTDGTGSTGGEEWTPDFAGDASS